MPTPIERITLLSAAVDEMTTAGVAPPKEYRAALDRWHEFANLDPRAQILDHLAAMVTTGDEGPLDLPLLTLVAINSTPSPRVEAEVRQHVAASVLPVIAKGARTVGAAAHEKLRERFNAAAERLAAAVRTVDPDAAPESILDAPQATREAWGAVPTIVAELDKILPSLRVAAELAGTTAKLFDLAVSVDPDAPAERRREVWGAWDGEHRSRAGRWGALIALSHVRIYARALDGLTTYRPPAPIETRYRPGAIGLRAYQHDPELSKPEPDTIGAR